MSKTADELRKYITQCLEQDLRASRALYDKTKEAYTNALVDGKTYVLELELLFKRAKLAEIQYSDAVRLNRLWQNQKQLLI